MLAVACRPGTGAGSHSTVTPPARRSPNRRRGELENTGVSEQQSSKTILQPDIIKHSYKGGKSFSRLFMAALLATLAHGRDWGAATPLPTPASLAVRPTAEPFNLKQVRLLDGPFRDAMLRNRQYLVNLDPDRLLVKVRISLQSRRSNLLAPPPFQVTRPPSPALAWKLWKRARLPAPGHGRPHRDFPGRGGTACRQGRAFRRPGVSAPAPRTAPHRRLPKVSATAGRPVPQGPLRGVDHH